MPTTQPRTLGQSLRRVPFHLRVLVWLLVICAVCYLLSATYNPVRLLYVLTIGYALVVLGFHLARSRRWRWPALAMLLVLAGWAIFAGRPYDKHRLRVAYVHRLRAFSGTRYIWGGETHIGIDCSGLARVALWEAMIAEGLRTGNPRLLGVECWSFWGHDMAARHMRDGRYGYTRVIDEAEALAEYDYNTQLQPGDLAATQDGSHVLIYLGDRQWIEANPDDGRVVSHRAFPESTRSYFNVPVTLLRWRMLEL